MFKAPKFGAYSELFRLQSPYITVEKNGALIYPWDLISCIPHVIELLLKSEQGVTHFAKAFFGWRERKVRGHK
jgi:hypothetical protein